MDACEMPEIYSYEEMAKCFDDMADMIPREERDAMKRRARDMQQASICSYVMIMKHLDSLNSSMGESGNEDKKSEDASHTPHGIMQPPAFISNVKP